MLNHLGIALLADSSAITSVRAQQALKLFAYFDLSVPRRLPPALLDREFGWPAGTMAALLAKLARIQLIIPVGAAAAASSSMWLLAPGYCWTPATLAQQWREMEARQMRVEMAQRLLQ